MLGVLLSLAMMALSLTFLVMLVSIVRGHRKEDVLGEIERFQKAGEVLSALSDQSPLSRPPHQRREPAEERTEG